MEFKTVFRLVVERGGIFWNPDNVDLDWLEEAEWLNYEEFRNGIETTS